MKYLYLLLLLLISTTDALAQGRVTSRPPTNSYADDDRDGVVGNNMPSHTQWTSDGNGNYYACAGDADKVGALAVTADATVPFCGEYMAAQIGSDFQTYQARLSGTFTNATYYMWALVKAPSLERRDMWVSSSQIDWRVHNVLIGGVICTQATQVWTWCPVGVYGDGTLADALVNVKARVSGVGQRSFTLNGSMSLYFTISDELQIGALVLATSATADPSTILGDGGGSQITYVVKKVSSAVTISSPEWSDANVVQFSGRGSSTMTRDCRLLHLNSTTDRLYIKCTASDNEILATETNADSVNVFNDDYISISWKDNILTTADSNTYKLAANARSTPTMADYTWPSGNQSAAGTVANKSCTSDLSGTPTWTIFCAMDLGFATVEGASYRFEVEVGDRDSGGVYAFKFANSPQDSTDPASWGVMQLSATIAGDGGQSDTTPPTASTCSVGSITQTTAIFTCTVADNASSLINVRLGWDSDNDNDVSGTLNLVYWETSFQQCSQGLCSIQMTGLTAGSSYEVNMYACDGASNCAFSAISDFTTTSAAGTTKYIATNGNNANDGSSGSPWLTWDYALQQLAPGSTLIAKNGTYSSANSGTPRMDCNAGYPNGTASQVITIKAENERQAKISTISSNDREETFQIWNCSYIRVEGFTLVNDDFNRSFTNGGSTFACRFCIGVTFTKNVVNKANRYSANSMGIYFGGGGSNTITDNEVYSIFRHSIILVFSNDNLVARNYVNKRNVGIGPCPLPCTNGGGVVAYPGSRNIFLNNIIEGTVEAGLNVIAKNSIGNKFYGNVVRGANKGVEVNVSDPFDGGFAINTEIVNNVIVGSVLRGIDLSSTTSTLVRNNSLFDSGIGYSTHAVGVRHVLSTSSGVPDGDFSVTVRDNLILNAGQFGVLLAGVDSYTIDYNRFNSVPSGVVFPANLTNTNTTTTTATGMGSSGCYIIQTNASGLKNAGSGGGNIGADLTYLYDNNINVTATAMWNGSDQASFQGATSTGINDVAGSSLYDVGARLRIGVANGCSVS